MNEKPPIVGVPHACTVALVELLKGDPQQRIGDIITDEELKRACGHDCRPGESGYAYLHSAIRKCLHQYGIFWKRMIKADCIKCLTAPEVIDHVDSQTKSIYRRAKQTGRVLQTVDTKPLSRLEQAAVNVKNAQLGTIVIMADSGTRKKLEARSVSRAIDLDKLLENMVNGR